MYRKPEDITHNGQTLAEILRLHGMWLRGEAGGARANLTYANLTYANLTGADLTGANLTRANLTDADLTGANLTDANLTDARMWGTAGNMREVRSVQIDTWPVTYTSDTMQIGCQRHQISKWRKWNTEAGRKWVAQMDGKALEWADRNLALILQIIDANPATNHAGHKEE